MAGAIVPQERDGHALGRSSLEASMQPRGCMLAPQDDGQIYAAWWFPSDRKSLL